MISIDINCDMGEFPDPAALALQEALMPHITSANIACGAHAGDEHTMRATLAQALRAKVSAGAHPGYPDPANFGRLEMEMPVGALEESVARQVAALAGMCAALAHVKPHGALYNRAARDPAIARAIMRSVAQVSQSLILVELAGSVALEVFRQGGFATAAEAFADRRYEPDGSLRSRRLSGALIEDPEAAAAQALAIARGKLADTICIHSDTPGALRIAEAVHRRLEQAGIPIAAL